MQFKVGDWVVFTQKGKKLIRDSGTFRRVEDLEGFLRGKFKVHSVQVHECSWPYVIKFDVGHNAPATYVFDKDELCLAKG